ncbi:hypothetical protein [Pseudidiomarina marina]|uniref:Uncharacterized protein n=1 Tax=Pseudidiomarina marina TaxID=502366 RepID=A0A432YJ96_9GAMM|nr:hypothetical protein [Pseudidiomarina marina]RUO61033.1 hypothetical protein CWI76_01805 [Pseudidiomarina marina]
MFQAKFLVVLMLGIVIQLSFPAAPPYNNASNVQHEKSVSHMDVSNESKDNFHCDESEQSIIDDCYCCVADKCSMDEECNSANSPLVFIQFDTLINSPSNLPHPLSYKADVKQILFDIYYPPK